MKLKLISCIMMTVLACMISGCGSGQVGISGRVVYDDDNSPLETGTVVFESGSNQSRGEIKEDGKFTVGTEKEKDGLPKGSYKVYINRATKTEGEIAPGIPNTVSLIDAKYNSPETSGLEFVVDGKQKNFDIRVSRNTKPAPKKRSQK